MEIRQLKDFIDAFQIDLDALARIRKRVFIVGRFNQSRTGGEPGLFLFTNRGDLDKRYTDNFTSVFDLRYESFVQALRPAIAERVQFRDEQMGIRFNSVEQVVPQGQGDDALEGTSVIDVFNYFFQRAVANSDQEVFQGAQPGLPKELLQRDDREAGKAILALIRKNLETFCTFQPRTNEIIESLSELLGKCGREHGLPPFASGGALPPGLPERVIDLVYAEDNRARFDPAGLEFSGRWEPLARDAQGREVFASVISAFRDALLGLRVEQHNDLEFRSQPLGRLAQDAVSEELKQEFQRSREAFNGLRQILRSKMTISMVLEWLLSTYYDLADVSGLKSPTQDQKDRAVEDAVLRRWKENKLAAPVKRPSRDERRRFSATLTENFERLLGAVIADDAAAEERARELPPELQELATELRGNAEKRHLLSAISGAKLGEDLHKAFVDASKTVLLDVLCPALYRNPIVTAQMLKKYFRQETMAAYLTAVFLGDSSQDAVRKIAEEHQSFFESKIDDATKELRDTGEIMQRLLRDFVDVMTQPEIQRRLAEGVRVLGEVNALLDDAEATRELGAGRISAIRTSDVVATGRKGTLDATPMDTEIIKVAVAKKARRAVEARLNTAAGSAAGAPAAAAAAGAATMAAPSTSSGAAVATAEPDETGDAARVETRLEQRINAIVGRLARPSTAEPPSAEQTEALTSQVTDEVLKDQPFIGGLAEDVRAFERTLHLIYSRYKDNPDKRTFRNKVERMTLINMMLLYQNELGLGRVCSNLYQLLMDLVLLLDPSNVDPKDFLRERSLTLYFDDADLDEGGITELRQTLEVQGQRSLANNAKFMSELVGVKYLMDRVGFDRDAEVIVVNATAYEFLDWLRSDNLTEGQGRGRLRAGMLVKTGQASGSATPPCLVYLTDIAFPGGRKGQWFQRLADDALRQGSLTMVLPPFCVSTGPQDEAQNWYTSGDGWAKSAERAPAPVVVVGPSPRANRPGDRFETTVPAGYLLCAHLLAAPDQGMRIESVARRSQGRFRVIGAGTAAMKDSLETVVWGEHDGDDYFFAVDFYLYLILTLHATAARYGGMQAVPAADFYACFHVAETVLDKSLWTSSAILDRAVLGGNALRFWLDQNPGLPDTPLESVTAQVGGKPRKVTKTDWFNAARRAAGL